MAVYFTTVAAKKANVQDLRLANLGQPPAGTPAPFCLQPEFRGFRNRILERFQECWFTSEAFSSISACSPHLLKVDLSCAAVRVLSHEPPFAADVHL